MDKTIDGLKSRYRSNPGWYWLLTIIFLFPILPEYVSPFILFAGFIVFKIQWSRQGKKARLGSIGKLMSGFLCMAIVSTLWSETKLSTFATAALWWGMFLVEIMIFNLVTTKKKLRRALTAMTLSGAVNGAVGALQICTYSLHKFGIIGENAVFVTPFYREFDKAVYSWLPFKIITNAWSSRASGFFSNPNLLATYMIIVYPVSIYLFLTADGKKKKALYFLMNVLISAGVSSTMSRAGCLIAIAGWVFMFIVLIKRYRKQMLEIFIPTAGIILPSILTRYGLIFQTAGRVTGSGGGGGEAKKSSEVHFQIWHSLIDHIINNVCTFIYGTGFGVEQTGSILAADYNLNKPHAHNFILETWMELGIIGMVLFGAILLCTFGKLLKINTAAGRRFALAFSIFTSLVMYLGFGLSDYIFNSPKQIILLFIILGITQAMSACYEKTLIKDTETLIDAAQKNLKNALR